MLEQPVQCRGNKRGDLLEFFLNLGFQYKSSYNERDGWTAVYDWKSCFTAGAQVVKPTIELSQKQNVSALKHPCNLYHIYVLYHTYNDRDVSFPGQAVF